MIEEKNMKCVKTYMYIVHSLPVCGVKCEIGYSWHWWRCKLYLQGSKDANKIYSESLVVYNCPFHGLVYENRKTRSK